MSEVVIKVIGNYSYQTSRCLGEGVYGKVYEGTERETKQKVAIKKIDLATFTNDKYLENAIFSEIYLLKRFNHPNIVKFKDVLSSKNSLYIITEFCKNGDLKELIKRKRFREEDVFEVMRQIMNGFSELIKQKIIHRDLKPANILIHDGVYKIGDFGFAKYVDNFGSQMLKSCVGSPIYMAPQILQRTQYTTKCDIWSMGIIFYQMIFGYPPWKARDEYELLRGIKTIPISHIIKRENLSTKASDFLKKTLAYSEQERIAWSQLFDMFGPKLDAKTEILQNKSYTPSNTSTSTKERGRISSNNNWTTSQNNIKTSNTPTPITPGTTISNNKTQLNSRQGNISPINSPDRRRQSLTSNNYFSGQLENISTSRQFCIYYNFFCVELFVKYSYVKNTIGSHEVYGKLLLVLSIGTKNRSSYCLSNVGIGYKQNKSLEELNKKMKQQHQSYQLLHNEIINHLEKEGIYKRIREDLNSSLGRGDVINEEKIESAESMNLKNIDQIVKIAHENAQVLSDEVRKKGKTIKDFTLVEILDFVLDVLSLAIGKTKALKDMKQNFKYDDEDLKDYLARVITKVDKLSANF